MPSGRMRLAYQIAAKRPAEAVRLIDAPPGQPTYGNEDYTKARRLWLAGHGHRAPRSGLGPFADRSGVCDLPAFVGPGVLALRQSGGAAGVLAIQAQQAGYPDMESAVYRGWPCG